MSPAERSSRPLTVAMLAPTRERCGIGDYSRLLVRALEALPEISAVTVVPTPEVAARTDSLQALRHYLADERRYYALGKQLNSADVAHIQHQYFFFGGVAPHKNHFSALLDAVRVPLVVAVHEIADGGTVGWRRALIEQTNRSNFLHPAIRQIIVHTQADVSRLQAIGVAEARLTVLPLAAPQALAMPDRGAAREALGLTGKWVVLMFGFLSAKKGHFPALGALKALPDDVVMLLAGEQHPDDTSDYVARLKAAIVTGGLEKRVQITGYLPAERVPDVMAAADIALVPFLESSGSASLAHLLAYGLPVLASDIPPHRELLAQNPGSLLLFPSGNAEVMAAQITSLLLDASLRRSLQSGADRFCAAHSFSQIANETLAIYRKAMGD
ncbi:MAG: hypothetical protein JWL77_5435 [Chthonomonadaceae bacterium]|nr:hypothetical protein [Chthonomonadaceae bacterium]